MADFRKVLLTLIAGALLFATVASAQTPYSCNATAVPTLARSEGIAERMGDVLLTCSGTVPTAGILANIRLRLTANITSNPLNTDRTRTEAMLILNENQPWYSGWWAYGSPANRQNVWQASRISDDEIEWSGVWLAAPGSPGAMTIRLTNVRGDVESRGDFATIYASINIVSPTSVPVDNNLLVVADTRPGLVFSVSSVDFKNCESPISKPVLKFQEGFASAFLPKGTAATDNTIPGGGYLNESGWNPGSLTGGTLTGQTSIGQANQGTRLLARFKNIPSGVTLSLPASVSTADGLVAWVVPDANSSGAGGTPSNAAGVTISDATSGFVVYEVVSITNASYSNRETVEVQVTVSYSIPGPLGAADVNGVLAPLSTVKTMNGTAPEPRFIDTASDKGIFSISACRTILLFPFVTNQANFDTGIAISNTSRDPIGTVNQSGACSLYYYGNTSGAAGPATQVTPSVPAGGHFVMGLSGGGGVFAYNGGFTACSSGNCVAPLFQGYIIAICNFQFAHGYAFISDFGARLFAQGYLALIIPDRGTGNRAPADSALGAATNQGEGLGN